MGASKVQLDFTNVKEGGGNFNKKHVAPGDYKGQIVSVADAVKKSDKSKKMWLFTIKVDSGTYPYYCSFEENVLWKIRNLFVAAGVNVPKKRVAVDPNKVVGKYIGVTLDDDEYDGKVQSEVASVFPTSELDETASDDDGDDDEEEEEEETEEEEDDDEEEEEPAPKKKKKGKAKKADVEDDELEELDVDEI